VLEKQAAAKEAKKNSRKLLQDAADKATLPTKEERAEKRRKLRAALGGAGAGDIALYLKRLFNEKGPDDDDIACLAGLISAVIVDSDEEDDAAAPAEPQSEPQSEPEDVAGGEQQRNEGYDEGYDDGYDEAYVEGYEEGYGEAAAAGGPVVVAEQLEQLAHQSLTQKKEQVIHAVPAHLRC
jgi:hypothetical protein